MIDFGLIKSKIEKVLVESYQKQNFKDELKKFKENVLDKKNVSKLFYLYDELNSKKGMNESIVHDYINECILVYENTVNKLRPSDFKGLNYWVGNIKTKNEYQDIDNLFSNDILRMESRLKSKKTISESLKRPSPQKKEHVKLPISTMITMANKTINNYVESLSESEKKELIGFLNSDNKQLSEDFNSLKKSVLEKLKTLKEGADSETLNRIDETIEKVSSEKYDKLTYFKLKGLKENL